MKMQELRGKSKDELTGIILNSKKEQFNLRFQAATGSLEKSGRVKELRKTVARAKTLLNEGTNDVKTPAPKKAAAKKPAAKAKKKDS